MNSYILSIVMMENGAKTGKAWSGRAILYLIMLGWVELGRIGSGRLKSGQVI